MIRIKICGIRESAIIDEAVRLDCDYAGLIFFSASPRNVSVAQAAALAAHAKGRLKTVAVVVDANDALLADIAAAGVDMLQLHGDESPQRVSEIKKKFGIPVIKAINVKNADDVAAMNDYTNADMLLFDAKTPGSGLAFDWTLLANRAIPLPWMLSGGLNAGNVAEAVAICGAKAVDVSSGVESAPGIKDANKMQEFVKAVRGI